MSRPGRHEHKLSTEIARFTNREDQRSLFRRYLHSATEPPVLMFFGVGGAGKSWLLKKLREDVPTDVPVAILDFDLQAGGQRFMLDPSTALYEIRQQLERPAPRCDLAFAMLRFKQGLADEPGFKGFSTLALTLEVAAEVVQKTADAVPGVNVVLNRLSRPLLERLKGTALERFLADATGSRFVLELRARTSQELGNELLDYLATDLRENLNPSLGRAVWAVLFFDTYEAISVGLQNTEHQRFREQWIRELAAKFDFALMVIAGQNRLTWDEAEPDWSNNLEQVVVGGLSETDSRQFLGNCGVGDAAMQAAILATAQENDEGSYHCFSLGLCVDIIDAERRSGREPLADTLLLAPQDWEALARRFLKSLDSDTEQRWIERLALTPRFDERAARAAFSAGRSAAQDTEWDRLSDYSFVQQLPSMPGWFAIRSQMRRALENQPSGRKHRGEDHQWWVEHWAHRSGATEDEVAPLAWYHRYCLEPAAANAEWDQLVQSARTSVPPRMQEHFGLLRWWEPVGLLGGPVSSPEAAHACSSLGLQFRLASLGNRTENLRQAIGFHEAALHFYTELDFPRSWAMTQNNLGVAWSDLPTGDRAENQRHAIACYEAALRVQTEQDVPRSWAMTQNNLGIAWSDLPTGERAENLRRAIACFEAALRVRTEQDSPQAWAMTQNNLGIAWSDLPTVDQAENQRYAISCYEAALRVYTEQDFPQDWAMTQNNLGNAWSDLPTGDQAENQRYAISCYEAALRVYTEQDFPQDWAMTQNNLGSAWSDLPTGDRAENQCHGIACYEAALRVYTEDDFPQDWAMTQNNLGMSWSDLTTGERAENLRRAIASYEAALRVYTVQDFPQSYRGIAAKVQSARDVLGHLD